MNLDIENFVKGYGFLSFATNMGINNGKNISKNWRSKCSQKLLDYAKQSDVIQIMLFKSDSKKQQNQPVI